ncbi:MAG TPA: alpha/beta fold hydrolase [Rhodothermales bacterium]
MAIELWAHRRGAGKPLIILHGLFGSGDNWRSLSRRFARQFDVHILDLRNHGRSPHDPEMSYRAMAEDVLQYLDRHRLDRSHIIGHSMGGKVAMACALMYPEAVQKLVVADIAPRDYQPAHDDIFAALDALDPSTLESRDEGEAILKQYLPAPHVRQFLLKNLQRLEDGAYEWKLNLPVIRRSYGELRTWPSFGGGTFPEPTLLIWGTESPYVTDEDRDAFLETFPVARFAGMKAGHWLHADDPGEFYRIVREFLVE